MLSVSHSVLKRTYLMAWDSLQKTLHYTRHCAICTVRYPLCSGHTVCAKLCIMGWQPAKTAITSLCSPSPDSHPLKGGFCRNRFFRSDQIWYEQLLFTLILILYLSKKPCLYKQVITSHILRRGHPLPSMFTARQSVGFIIIWGEGLNPQHWLFSVWDEQCNGGGS